MEEKNSTYWLLVVESQIDRWTILQEKLTGLLPQITIKHDSSVITALSRLQNCLAENKPSPSLILLNLYLPERNDGFHLLVNLKSVSSSFKHVPVVVITSSTEDQDRQDINQRGGICLVMPNSEEEWNGFIRTIQYYWQKSNP